MYTYLKYVTPNVVINVEGELNTITVEEPVKGIIQLNTHNRNVTVYQLVISLWGVRKKGRELKLDSFNVKHHVDIENNNIIRFPFKMIINPSKWDSSMTIDIEMTIKTSEGDFKSRSSLLNITTGEAP